MRAIWANIFDNPILTRELRRRMRGKALIWSIITYLCLITLSTILVLVIQSPPPGATASMEVLQQLHRTGSSIYYWITGIQVLLVLIVAPAITAGLTTNEKELKTFDFLRVTTITRWMYVMGCFLSTSFYVALALICALPPLSLAFLYGGVTLEQVVRTFCFLMAGSCLLSSFGLYLSSVCERTRTAQGIVVFLILALLLGGLLGMNIYQTVFAGAGGQSVLASAGNPGVVYLFNLGVPQWVLMISGFAALTAVFLLLAARKLFEPEEVRALSHWQYGVIFGVLLLYGLGLLNGNAFANEVVELGYLAVMYVMLLVAVFTFAVGRMEVGDEIWHLKRVFPMLRPVDQTVPFLALVGLVWWLALGSLPRVASSLNIPEGLPGAFALITVTSFAFFVFFARGAMGLTGSRRKAATATTFAVLLFLFVWPLIIRMAWSIFPEGGGLWRDLSLVSPFAMLLDAFHNPNVYTAGGLPTGTSAAIAYSILALMAAALGEAARWKRWHHFDYHYDMPAG